MWRFLIGIFVGIALTIGGWVGFTIYQKRSQATAVVKAPPQTVGAAAALKAHSKRFARRIEKVAPNIEVAIGYGLANVVLIEAPGGLILLDSLESIEAARALRPWIDRRRKESGKEITHLVYTHNHADHIFGAGELIAGQTTKPQVWAHPGTVERVHRVVNVLRAIIQKRSMRQFGVYLKKANKAGGSLINTGIGMELKLDHRGMVHFVHPTNTFGKPAMDVEMAGMKVRVLWAPGETDDQLTVFLPDQKVLFPADNYYHAFPNLYAIRGTPYRDVRKWAGSIDAMRALKPVLMVPQHSQPVAGAKEIETRLRNYRDAIQFVHDQTIRWMNKGLTPDEIVTKVQLPPHLRGLPYLQEFYGRVDWSVRSVFSGYLGWFSGDPADLSTPTPKRRAELIAQLAGGADTVAGQARAALKRKEPNWALILSGHLQRLGHREAKEIRIAALQALGAAAKNATARNYYLTAAAEAGGFVLPRAVSTNAPAEQFANLPVGNFIQSLKVALQAERTLELELPVTFRFTDLNTSVTLTIRRGVLVETAGRSGDSKATVVTTSATLKEVLSGRRNPLIAFAGDAVDIEGSAGDVRRFFGYFDRN